MEEENKIAWLEKLAILLDAKFQIPGTNFKFGIDPLIGLFPFLGSLLSYLFSCLLIFYMAKNGASFTLIARMFAHVFFDYLIGNVPLVGQFADFIIKANLKNFSLYKALLNSNTHKKNEPIILLVFVTIFLLIPIALTTVIINLVGNFFNWIIGG